MFDPKRDIKTSGYIVLQKHSDRPKHNFHSESKP